MAAKARQPKGLRKNELALQHPQPRGRGVQFGLGAVLHHSITPRGRIRGRGRETKRLVRASRF
jgi:hypothetical protein